MLARTRPVLVLLLLVIAAPIPARSQGEPPLVSPGDFDFSESPLRGTEYELRWIVRPDSAAADTTAVYMKIEDFLSEGEPVLRATWLPMSRHIANMDLILMDPATYAVRYRLEPRGGGGYGIFWYDADSAWAAQVDSTGTGSRSEMPLERPVFSVPSLPWVLAQLAGRVDEPVRLEVPGFSPERGANVSTPVMTPGDRLDWTPPEGGGSYPVREMTVEFDDGRRWRYLVSSTPPYFFGVRAWNTEGVMTTRAEVVAWARPALDRSRRLPQLLRQDLFRGN